ncbi:MAG: hypothetical protein HC798_00760, partial [Polaribacter sp.]|nr:hypothetical protein [Polaribacter sp.]
NVANTKSDVMIAATDFFDAFSNDEITANKNYLDKIVAVSGAISKIEKEDEITIITLQTNDDFGSVLCHLSEEASKNSDAYKIEDNIILKGICTGFLMDVVLVKCEIIK